MSPRASSALTVAPSERNEKPIINPRYVALEADFQGLFKGDSVNPLVEDRPEPEIELIEEVGAKALCERSLPVPPCNYHLRIEFADGRVVFVSFNGQVKTDTDGARTYAEPQVSNLYIDGRPSALEVVGFLGKGDLQILEEWLLEERRNA